MLFIHVQRFSRLLPESDFPLFYASDVSLSQSSFRLAENLNSVSVEDTHT